MPEKTVNVSALHIHRDHDREKYNEDNDIALLELAEEVDLNIYTPACMAQVWTHTWMVMYSTLNVNCLTSEYGHRGILREDSASVRLGRHHVWWKWFRRPAGDECECGYP